MQKNRKIIIGLTGIFALLFCCIGLLTASNIKGNASLNYANISQSAFMSPGQKEKVVFYRSDISNSLNAVTNAYTLDKLTFNPVKYRDVSNTNNEKLQSSTKINTLLTKQTIRDDNGKINVIKQGHMTKWYSIRTLVFMTSYVLMIVVFSYLLTLLVLKLCF